MNNLSSSSIESILVVDDDAEAREGFRYSIEELEITPVLEEGPIKNLAQFVKQVPRRAQAVLCDYRLKTSGTYSSYGGDEVVAACYRSGIPGLLCTQYTDVVFGMNRRLRRFIPSLLNTSSPTPDDIRASLRACQEELSGSYHPARRPWRALVRVHDAPADADYCHVIVPAWNADQEIRLYLRDLPDRIRPCMTTGARLHAKVNIGADADSFEELYFYEWEPPRPFRPGGVER